MNQATFMKLLSELLETAAVSGGSMAKADVDQWFEDLSLGQEQMELVYQYLKDNQVTVVWPGEKPPREAAPAPSQRQTEPEQEEENRYYRMYLDDLAAVAPCTIEEIQALLPAALTGDLQASDRLAEGNLHRIAQWARPFVGKGVVISDLVQEGSMILMEEIHALRTQYTRLDAEDFLYIVQKNCQSAMEALIQQQEGQKDIGEKVASRANRIMDLTEEIAQEYGTEATAAQLAQQLHITEDEVKDIMKMSLDVISMAEAIGDPAAFEPDES